MKSNTVVGLSLVAANMTHFEDYELAQTIQRDLLELRVRANSAAAVELSVIAAKAELPPNWQPQERRAAVGDARTSAWLAICRLASETANNEKAAEENAPNSIIDTILFTPLPSTASRPGGLKPRKIEAVYKRSQSPSA